MILTRSDNQALSISVRLTYVGGKNASYFASLGDTAPEPGAFALGALADEKPAAVIVFSMEEHACMLTWLFVHPDVRHYGIASELLTQASGVLAENGIEEILCYYPGQEDLIGFFAHHGAVSLPTSTVYSVPFQELFASDHSHILKKHHYFPTISPFCNLTDTQKKACRNLLFRHPTLDASLLDESSLDKRLSFVYFEDRQPSGMVIVSDYKGDNGQDIYVNLAYSTKEDHKTGMVLLSAFYQILEKLNLQGKLYFLSDNTRLISAIERFMGHPLSRETAAWTAFLG